MEKVKIEELRLAQSVISTAVNPDSGKIIFWPMRMSSFLPLNIPINFGLIVSPPSPFNTIFWNWINQTYNAQCNYGNRNASSQYTVKTIIKSYVAACLVSISIALFSRQLVSKWTADMTVGGMLFIFNSVTSYLSCASAGFCNVLMMRYSELVNGISVFDPADKSRVIAQSKTAARKAVLQTGLSRFVLALPIIGPSIVMFFLEKLKLMPQNFWAVTFLQMSLFFC